MAEVASRQLTGGCQCGATRYALAAPPLFAYCCHCANCQRITASAFAISCIVPKAALVFTKGAPARHEWTADSGTPRYGFFCPDCGVRIAHGQEGDGPSAAMYSLRGGTLDDRGYAAPVAHIWMSSAVPWFAVPQGDLTFEAQPKDYAPIAALYAARLTGVAG
ncbi:MAG: aldehyde-activating protein [Alphaproteobacteria bacterium]|nr:aldehyde-activating protein [Alphaproteobacteria bacterium]